MEEQQEQQDNFIPPEIWTRKPTALKADLQRAENWELVWYETFTAVRATNDPTDRNFVPIGEKVCPQILTGQIAAVYVECPNARNWWVSAGIVFQSIRLGLTIGGDLDSANHLVRNVILDKVNLLYFPSLSKFNKDYALHFIPRRWHDLCTINVWQFTGPEEDDVQEALTALISQNNIEINAKLDEINAKIDMLLNP